MWLLKIKARNCGRKSSTGNNYHTGMYAVIKIWFHAIVPPPNCIFRWPCPSRRGPGSREGTVLTSGERGHALALEQLEKNGGKSIELRALGISHPDLLAGLTAAPFRRAASCKGI